MAHHNFIPLKNYRVIEHTADLALSIQAPDLAGLFKNSASAIFEISTEKINFYNQASPKKISIKQQAATLEELFINWLNELLSLSSAKGLVFTNFKINKISAGALDAVVTAEGSSGYKINKEIKAATYSGLKLQNSGNGWQVEVILDV